MTKYRKYPSTPHFQWSRTISDDDFVVTDTAFLDREVVVTEKMDGENTTLYNDKLHARSIDSAFHPSRSWAANFHSTFSYLIPSNRRIIVENLYAEHSIRYDNLTSYVNGIAVIDCCSHTKCPGGSLCCCQDDPEDGPVFLSWDDTVAVFDSLGIVPVPVLYRGKATEAILRGFYEGLDHSHQEGIVVRSAGSFKEADFASNVAKAVRPHHVQTTEHWQEHWKPNALAAKE